MRFCYLAWNVIIINLLSKIHFLDSNIELAPYFVLFIYILVSYCDIATEKNE